MRPFRHLGRFVGLSSLGLTLLAGHARAYPHRGELMEMAQPDGSRVDVVVWGDEFYVRAETPSGYTLIVDPITGYISYALSTSDGDLVSSGVVYDGVMDDQALVALGLKKGATHSKTLRDALASANQSRLNPNLGKISRRIGSASNASLDVIQPIGDPVPTGTITGLVVLVDFPDRASSIAASEVENAFNSTGTYGSSWHGSIRKWSEQISDGITSVQHKVVGYYTAKYDVAHYNAPTAEWDYSTSEELYKEVYAYIDANLDLTSYAVNNRLPSLALIYAGDIIAKAWAMALWPHGGCGGGRYRTSEGVTIDKCFLTNLGSRTPISLSTFRHELGHSVFLWPDTYDYDDDSESGGGFATETDLPCAPFRMWAGWVKPTVVTSNTGVYSVAANGSSILRYNNSSNTGEYFIAEYAKKITWRQPPDEGLLIWHIDEDGDNSWQDMTPSRHYAMSVEQADGKFDLEHNVRAGAGDLYHAGDKTRFDDTTTPNSNWWNGSKSGFKLCDIGGITADTMSVNVGCVTAGGATGTGGVSSTGGSSAQGGTSSTGGTASLGGTSSTGGSISKGGAINAGGATGKGGSNSSGGATVATGGTSSVTGTGGNASSSGGTLNGTGGASAATGGMKSGTGGSVSTGGVSANSGGTMVVATGGTPGTGGLRATGGSLTATGGTIGSPGNTGGNPTSTTGPVTSGDGGEEGGCSCRVASSSRGSGLGAVFGTLAALALGWRRRRRN